MKKIVSTILAFLMILSSLSTMVYAEGTEVDNAKEKNLAGMVLPVLQSYEVTDKELNWELDETTRFVVPKTEENMENSRLSEVIKLASSEFLAKEIPLQKEIKKVYAEEDKITPKDIVIEVTSDEITSKTNSLEAYKIDINEKGVKVLAASENAVLHALHTIEQLMIVNNKKLPYGVIIDYPNVAERRVHLDMGRKYISKDWIIQHIRELSYLKMNTLQLHFSENLGFRIESEVDPAIVSEEHLTKDEIREILKEAKKYGIKIIPSLDTPGHVNYILRTHPEYGQVDINGMHSTSALDVTNPKAVEYMKSLYKEYMDLFEGSTDFHLGGDEYMEFDRPPFTTNYQPVLDAYARKTLGEGYLWKDVLAKYINDLAEYVHSNGFKPRIWNDGIYYGERDYEGPQKIKMHDYIGIDFWSQMGWNWSIARLNTFIEKGHTDIYNVNASYFYYVLRPSKPNDGREQHSFDFLNQDERIYNEWTPGKFQDNTIDDNHPSIRGASLAIWNDKPDLVGEDVITEDIAKELRSLASKAWNVESNNIMPLDDFRANYKLLGNVAGFEKGSELPEVQDFDLDEKEKPKEEVLNYALLDELIEESEEYREDVENVSEEALEKFDKTLDKVLNIRNSAKNQEEIDNAYNLLKEAYNLLLNAPKIDKGKDKDEDDDKNKDKDKNIIKDKDENIIKDKDKKDTEKGNKVDNKIVDVAKGEKNTSKVLKEKEVSVQNPRTGDSTNIDLLLGVLSLSLLAYVFINKKVKE